jgi:hypothetical protein
MFSNGIFDDTKEFLLGGSGADGHTVEQLHHETGEALEGTGDANGGVYLNEDTLGRVDIDLELPDFVDGRVEESEEALQVCWLLVLRENALSTLPGE